MGFVTLWMLIGLSVLVCCGLEETIAFIGFDCSLSNEEISPQVVTVYIAVCLFFIVLSWPLILMELVRGSQR